MSEFLLLVAALCEVKARRLLGEGDSDIEEQGPEEAAAELAARLAEYQRFRAAAGWLGARREELGRRFFRTRSRAAGAETASRRPAARAARGARRGDRPPARATAAISTSPPSAAAACRSARSFARFRDLLRERGTFMFDEQVEGLSRRGAGGRVPRTARAVQARRAACRPGRGVRPDPGRAHRRPARGAARARASRARASRRMSGELTHVVEALLFVSGEPLTVAELATAAEAPARARRAGARRARRAARGGAQRRRARAGRAAASASAPRRRPPTRARGSCSVRRIARSRRPRSRRSR